MDIHAKTRELVSNNQEAYDFIMNLWGFVVAWDDAVDRDKAGSPEEINASMIWAMLEMSEGTFYKEHTQALRPALFMMISDWLTANKFEKSKDRALVEQGYFLRCSPFNVFCLVVFLVSGFHKATEAVEFFRGSFREDTLESYLKEHLGE